MSERRGFFSKASTETLSHQQSHQQETPAAVNLRDHLTDSPRGHLANLTGCPTNRIDDPTEEPPEYPFFGAKLNSGEDCVYSSSDTLFTCIEESLSAASTSNSSLHCYLSSTEGEPVKLKKTNSFPALPPLPPPESLHFSKNNSCFTSYALGSATSASSANLGRSSFKAGLALPGKPFFPPPKISRFPGKAPDTCPPGTTLQKRTKQTLLSNLLRGTRAVSNKRSHVATFFGPKPPASIRANKTFQWQNLPHQKILGTVWESILHVNQSIANTPSDSGTEASSTCSPHPTGFSLNYKNLTDQFLLPGGSTRGSNARNSKKGGGVNQKSSLQKQNPKGVSQLVVLDAKRRQNIEICLKGLGLLNNINCLLNTIELYESQLYKKQQEVAPATFVLQLSNEGRHLSPESLQMVLNLYPTVAEQRALRAAELQIKSDSTKTLGKVERFMLSLLNEDNIVTKTECCLLRQSFAEECESFCSKLNRLQPCVLAVVESLEKGALKCFLQLVLNIGNYINYGSKHGDACGFSVDSLSLLRTTKSVDGTTTLLRVIAECCMDPVNTEIYDKLRDVLKKCHTVVDCSITDQKTMFKNLNDKLPKLEGLVSRLVSNDKFKSSCIEFLKNSKDELSNGEQLMHTTESGLLNVCFLLGEEPKTSENGFSILTRLDKFGKELSTAETHILAKRARESAAKTARRSSVTTKPSSTEKQSTATSLKQEEKNQEGTIYIFGNQDVVVNLGNKGKASSSVVEKEKNNSSLPEQKDVCSSKILWPPKEKAKKDIIESPNTVRGLNISKVKTMDDEKDSINVSKVGTVNDSLPLVQLSARSINLGDLGQEQKRDMNSGLNEMFPHFKQRYSNLGVQNDVGASFFEKTLSLKNKSEIDSNKQRDETEPCFANSHHTALKPYFLGNMQQNMMEQKTVGGKNDYRKKVNQKENLNKTIMSESNSSKQEEKQFNNNNNGDVTARNEFDKKLSRFNEATEFKRKMKFWTNGRSNNKEFLTTSNGLLPGENNNSTLFSGKQTNRRDIMFNKSPRSHRFDPSVNRPAVTCRASSRQEAERCNVKEATQVSPMTVVTTINSLHMRECETARCPIVSSSYNSGDATTRIEQKKNMQKAKFVNCTDLIRRYGLFQNNSSR